MEAAIGAKLEVLWSLVSCAVAKEFTSSRQPIVHMQRKDWCMASLLRSNKCVVYGLATNSYLEYGPAQSSDAI